MLTRIEAMVNSMLLRTMANEAYHHYITPESITILMTAKAYVELGRAGKFSVGDDGHAYYRGYLVRLVTGEGIEVWVTSEHGEIA